jgi:hypothetical protein
MTRTGAKPEVLWWDRRLFKSGAALDQPCPKVIDVTGRMRVLVFGPMIILPAGQWRLRARFGLSPDAALHSYILQFIHGDSLIEQRLQPAAGGEFEVVLENGFAVDAMVALRLWLADPAFHGELGFIGASVERLGPHPDQQNDVATGHA